jgi:ornithine carbamoyltransferase
VNDWSKEELRTTLDLADELKTAVRERREHRLLPGRTLAMIFHRQSLRTRVSFAVAMTELGGNALDLPDDGIGFGVREPIRDVALALSRYADAIMIRTPSQEQVDELAEHATVPVVNAMTDQVHPCQALTDLMTIRERFGRLSGVRLAYVGDGNNVCRSLGLAAAMAGMDVRLACPAGYGLTDADIDRAAVHGSVPLRTTDPAVAVKDADVVYTDVWVSMGEEREAATKRDALGAYRVTSSLLAEASPDAIFLHCLPAHRGEEVDADVIDGARSRVWQQAENRMHAARGLLAFLLGPGGRGKS